MAFHICMAADENYVKYAAVLMTSIVRNIDKNISFESLFNDQSINQSINQSISSAELLKDYKKLDYQNLKDEEKQEKIIFHLLSDFIQTETQNKLKALEKDLNAIYSTEIQIHILSDAIFKSYPQLGSSHIAYFRLYIQNLLPNDVERALYLDVDMLVCADIRALWCLDIQQQTAAVLGDCGAESPRPRKSLHGKKDFVFNDFYFNSGFMFINIKKLKENNVFQKCIDYLNNYETLSADQDALNYAIREQDILEIPFSFNCFAASYIEKSKNKTISNRFTAEDLRFWMENPVILHFAGIVKPWENPFIVQNEKGEYIGLRYVAQAEKSFCFSDDITRNLILYCQKIHLARIVFQKSNTIFGLFAIPFMITQIKMRDFKKEEILEYLKNYDQDHLFADFSENGKDHLIKELYAKYIRAKNKKSLFYLLKLPLAILKVQHVAKNKK